MSVLVVNFYGGPGSGKSTMCAHTFAELKWKGYNCEIASEYAKDKVWENSLDILDNQVYIFGKQYHRLFRLRDKVDIILTDSPLLLSLIYGNHMNNDFKKVVVNAFHEFDNFNIFLTRQKGYNPAGRVQSETKAREIDTHIDNMLRLHGFDVDVMFGARENVPKVVELIEQRLGYSGNGEATVQTPISDPS